MRFLSAGISDEAGNETRRLLRFHRLAVLVFLWVAPMFAVVGFVNGVSSVTALMLVTCGVYDIFDNGTKS